MFCSAWKQPEEAEEEEEAVAAKQEALQFYLRPTHTNTEKLKMAEANKRNIPIKLGDFSVIDTEFSSIRERFDSEMRKMEEEMAKFRHELMNREANFFESTR